MRLTTRSIGVFLTLAAASVIVVADGTASQRVSNAPSSLVRVGAGDEYVPDEVIVQFGHQPTRTDLQIAAVSVDALSWQPLLLRNVFVAKLRESTTVPEAVAELSARSDVVYAEPNQIYHAAAIPNDPRFEQNWGLHNTGQSINGGPPGVDDADNGTE